MGVQRANLDNMYKHFFLYFLQHFFVEFLDLWLQFMRNLYFRALIHIPIHLTENMPDVRHIYIISLRNFLIS